MRRDQLAHLIRAAAEISGERQIIVVGSQAILGSLSENRLPPETWHSLEADLVLAAAKKGPETEALLGADSRFSVTHGIWVDVVGIETAALPRGWRRRLVPLVNEDTGSARALCLERHDLVISKLVAGREKDLVFARALLEARLISLSILRARARFIDGATPATVNRIREWIAAQERRRAE
jgi:hypothetical protein